jgi:hypothetical protein
MVPGRGKSIATATVVDKNKIYYDFLFVRINIKIRL